MSETLPISIPADFVEAFCRKWRIAEFSLFGSVLRPDFRPHSGVDVLVAFEVGHSATLEEWIQMEEKLQALLAREIDLVERQRVEYPFRRHHILTHRQILYAA